MRYEWLLFDADGTIFDFAAAEEGALWRSLADHGIEVGGGLGEVAGKIWRVSAMGNSARMPNVHRFLASLDAVA